MAPAHCSLHSAKHEVRAVYRQTPPLTERDARRIAKRTRCLEQSDRRTIHIFRNRMRAWRRAHKWLIEWRRLSPYDRRWAKVTGACESGNDPRMHSTHGDHGAMQFKLATAYSAGFKVDPHLTSIYEQWVRAVWWRNVEGRGQWPVCGHRV